MYTPESQRAQTLQRSFQGLAPQLRWCISSKMYSASGTDGCRENPERKEVQREGGIEGGRERERERE